jgi:hypothetical protein
MFFWVGGSMAITIIVVDGWRTSMANVVKIQSRLRDRGLPVVSPVWPESPDAPVEEYEAALINIIPTAGKLIFYAHSYGSCVVERCFAKGYVDLKRIEYVKHYSPLFKFNETAAILIKYLPGWMPYRFNKRVFTDELWINSYHPKRGIRIRHFRHLLNATEGLSELVGGVTRTIHLVQGDPLVDSILQEIFVKCEVMYSDSKMNKHRSAWESIE